LKVLVVGAAGYIGSHTARVLRRAGLEVLIYDNLSTGFDFLAKGFETIVGDVHDSKKLLPAVKQSDAVMHFAANHFVGESVVNPQKYFRNNVEGGLSPLNTVLEAGKKTIVIFSSTCAVYGSPAKMPISEDCPLAPINPYGVSKIFSNKRCSPMTRPTDFVMPACATSTPREPMKVERLGSVTSPSHTSSRWH